MSTSVMIIVIVSVVFGVLYEMYKKHLEFKAKTINHNNEQAKKDEAIHSHYAEQIQQLTERIEVLERIVTDEGYQVQKDIKNL